MLRCLVIVCVTGCVAPTPAEDIDPDDDVTRGMCAGSPTTAPASGFRHLASQGIAALGGSRHRGIDLIVVAGAEQILEGELSYSPADKALADEDVELFACRDRQWQSLGVVGSDGDGHFRFALDGAARVSLGMTDLFASVTGDRTGTRFLGLVAPTDSAIAVSDVDGTLTESENAFAEQVIGIDIALHDGAVGAFAELARRGYQPIYVTARPRMFTEDTRMWLAGKGLPRGPVRLAPGVILPGDDTVNFKVGVLAELAGFDVAIGNGNRATDVEAYQRAGIAAARTFIKLPEFMGEVQTALDRGDAVGILHYDELRAVASQLPQR